MLHAPRNPESGQRARWLRRLGLRLLWLGSLVYLGVAVVLFAMQRSMLFVPDVNNVAPEVERFAGAEAIILTTTDGERLNAWFKPPADGKPVYLYLHGNGASLTRRAGRFVRMTDDGAGLLAISWRGYGGSSGSPSEAGLKLDGSAGYDWLAARYATDRIILFGESLGTGIAIWLASTRPATLLALDSPYAAIDDLGAMRFPFLPVRWLSRDPFRSIDLAPKITIPVIAQHCRTDWVIPLSESERLMRAFSRPPDFTIIESRCHVPDVGRALLPKIQAASAMRRG